MKGIMFTEFLEMVEVRFGLPVLNQIIVAANIPHDGAYTAVGTYDHAEMVRLVGALSHATGSSSAELIQAFGRHLFERLRRTYPIMFVGVKSAFEFLANIERHIHMEVRKLYPDAELPSFSYEKVSDRQLVMVYRSSRPFTDLADGLIQGCLAYYDQNIQMQREDLASTAVHSARFILTREH